jgi:hypothetical protein
MKSASSQVATGKQNEELPPSSSIPRPANPVGFIRGGTPMPETPSIEGGMSQPQPPPQQHPPSAQPQRKLTDALSADEDLKLTICHGFGFTERALNCKTLLEFRGDLNLTLYHLHSQSEDPTGLPHVKWYPQVVWLREMGFTNWAANYQMICRCDGDVDAAVTMLHEDQEQREQQQLGQATQDPIERPKLKLKLRLADRAQPETEALKSMLRRELSDVDAEGEDEDAEGEDEDAEGDVKDAGEDTEMKDAKRPDNNAARPDPASLPRSTTQGETPTRRSRSTWIVLDSLKSPDAGLPQEQWSTRTGKACMGKGPPQEHQFDIDAELANVRAALEALKAAEAERASQSLSNTEDHALSPGTSTEIQDSEMTGVPLTSTDDAPQDMSEAALAKIRERMRSVPGLVDERRDSAHSRKNSGQDSRKSSVESSRKNSEVASRRNSRLASQNKEEETEGDEGHDNKQDQKTEEREQGKREQGKREQGKREENEEGEDML